MVENRHYRSFGAVWGGFDLGYGGFGLWFWWLADRTFSVSVRVVRSVSLSGQLGSGWVCGACRFW